MTYKNTNMILEIYKNSIKQKLIERVKGTVSVYHFYDSETDEIDITVAIQNYAHVFHYTIYDFEKQVLNSVATDEIVNQIIKQYRFTLFAKFFRTPRKQEYK